MPAAEITSFPRCRFLLCTEIARSLNGLPTEPGLSPSISETVVRAGTLSVPLSNIERFFALQVITACCEREPERKGWFHRNG
jgi:hypothetical protein